MFLFVYDIYFLERPFVYDSWATLEMVKCALHRQCIASWKLQSDGESDQRKLLLKFSRPAGLSIDRQIILNHHAPTLRINIIQVIIGWQKAYYIFFSVPKYSYSAYYVRLRWTFDQQLLCYYLAFVTQNHYCKNTPFRFTLHISIFRLHCVLLTKLMTGDSMSQWKWPKKTTPEIQPPGRPINR